MCNPLVYGIRNQAFRREMFRLYASCGSKCLRSRRVSAEVRSSVERNSTQVVEVSGVLVKTSPKEVTSTSKSKLDFQDTASTGIA